MINNMELAELINTIADYLNDAEGDGVGIITHSLQEAGFLTNDQGIYLRTSEGQAFVITVKEYKP